MIKLIDSCKKARTYLARPSQEYSLLEFSEMLAGDENAITRTEYLGRVRELEHDFHIGMIAKGRYESEIKELQEGRDNLEKLGYSVDYVITHCMSGGMQDKLLDRYGFGRYGSTFERDVLTDFFDELETKLRYKWWFCGHYHENMQLDDRHMILYEDIVRLGDFQ